jgi:hypothetical protein
MTNNQIIPPADGQQDIFEGLLANGAYKNRKHIGPLQKLKTNLAASLIFAVLITLGYGLLIFYFPIWQVQIALLICIGFNIWVMVNAWRIFESINPDLGQADVLNTLIMHRDQFHNWFRQQMRTALFVYPVATAGGYMLGGTIGSGKPVEEFMRHPFTIVMLIISILVLVPLSYWLAKWMNKKAFGQYVDQLEKRIEELQADA